MHVRVNPRAVDSEVVVGGQYSTMDCIVMLERLEGHLLLAWSVCMNPDEVLAVDVLRASSPKSVRLAEFRPLPGLLSSCGVATVPGPTCKPLGLSWGGSAIESYAGAGHWKCRCHLEHSTFECGEPQMTKVSIVNGLHRGQHVLVRRYQKQHA